MFGKFSFFSGRLSSGFGLFNVFGDIAKSLSKLGFVKPLFFDLVILEKFCSWTVLLILVVRLILDGCSSSGCKKVGYFRSFSDLHDTCLNVSIC